MTSGPPSVTAGQDSIAGADLDTFYRDLQNAHLRALWKLGPDLLPSHPHPRTIPWVWRASETFPLAVRAIRAVPADGHRRIHQPEERNERASDAAMRHVAAASWT